MADTPINRSPGRRRKLPGEHKTITSVRFSPGAIIALDELVGVLGIRRTDVIEYAIHQLRKRYRQQLPAKVGSLTEADQSSSTIPLTEE